MKSSIKKEKILVVDDVPDTLEILRRNLALKDYQVFTSSSVNEAFKLLETVTVDLVITDYKMPKRNGLDLIRYITENFKNTGIIMITGYASINGAVEAIKCGAMEYLSKPSSEMK